MGTGISQGFGAAQAPHGRVRRVPPARQGQPRRRSLFGDRALQDSERYHRRVGRGGPRSALRCAKGWWGRKSPSRQAQVIP